MDCSKLIHAARLDAKKNRRLIDVIDRLGWVKLEQSK